MKSFVRALVVAAVICTASANNEFEPQDPVPETVPEEEPQPKLPRNAYIKKLTGHNWSNNILFSGKGQYRPDTKEGVVEAVQSKLTKRIRVRGSKHSFNDIADCDGMFISLGLLSYTRIDPNLTNVTVGAGITYTMLLQTLQQHKVALHNLPSLPHLAVIGSTVTGTHGGGTRHQQMAGAVFEIELITPQGEIRHINRETDPLFESYLHAAGTTGAITQLKMEVHPEYAVLKCIYEDLSWDFLDDKENYKNLMKISSFLSFFTNWQDRKMTSVWVGYKKTTWDDGDMSKSYDQVCDGDFFGAKLVERIHPVPGRDSKPCVTSGLGMWYDKIFHFKPDEQPSSGGDEIQSEFFVDFADFPSAMKDLFNIAPLFAKHLQITEIRAVKADTIPLSPAKDRDVVGIHFTWKHDFVNVMTAVELVKAALVKYDYRVHWGKYFGRLEKNYLNKIYGAELDILEKQVLPSLLPEGADPVTNKFLNCFTWRLIYDRHTEGYEQECEWNSWHEVEYEKNLGGTNLNTISKNSKRTVEHFARMMEERLQRQQEKNEL